MTAPATVPATPEGLACVILAGGRARRMRGIGSEALAAHDAEGQAIDKGLLALGDTSVLGHVIGRLGPQCAALAINANGDPARFAAFGLPILPDPALPATVPPRPGPLAGMLAAMTWAAAAGYRAVVTVAADTPFLPPDLVARLSAAACAPSPPGLLPAIAATRGRMHPVCGLWPVALHAPLRDALIAGTRRAGDWAAAQGAVVVPFPVGAVDPFFNINTPADLVQAQAHLATIGAEGGACNHG